MTDDLIDRGVRGPPPPTGPPEPQQRFPFRFGGLQGAAAPVLTTLIAFLMGGVAVAVIGNNPIKVYQAIFKGTGLNFLFHFGSHSIRLPFSTQHVWFWWDTSSIAAQNLEQTLLITTPIICTALALAFAFRCGLFNIGGQGQYLVGSYFAVWVGTSFVHLAPFLHVVFCLVAGALAGAVYAGIAGLLKATVGAHEVITTIMLNWTAVGSARTCSDSKARCRTRRSRRSRSRTTSPTARSSRCSGARSCCRASRSASSSRSRSWSSTGS